MQCASCQFENMPGVTVCGRCGGMLQAGSVAIDVHPPRASARAKVWRRRMQPVRAPRISLENAVARLARSTRCNWDLNVLQERPVIRRMVLPGWPQLYCGGTVRGGLLLIVWAGLLVLGILYSGTPWGSLCLGFAIAVHVASILDLTLSAGDVSFERLKQAGVALLLLCCLLYLPAGLLLGQVATPRRMTMHAGPFAAGDVVLVNRSQWLSGEVEPGTLVLYEITPLDFMGRTAGANVRTIVRGERIDRVLAGAGAQVAWQSGRLTVDGVPSHLQPLVSGRFTADFSLVVPPDSFFILPSTDPVVTDDVVRQVCIVPASQVMGNVYWQTLPLSEFGVIR